MWFDKWQINDTSVQSDSVNRFIMFWWVMASKFSDLIYDLKLKQSFLDYYDWFSKKIEHRNR